jgi:acetyl-CoA acyltransferase
MRRCPYPFRPLRRHLVPNARRRPWRFADQGTDGSERWRGLASGRRYALRVREPGRRGNRNVGRMAALLAALPVEVPANTINRLCGSSLDAVGIAARAVRSGEVEFVIAGGLESISRAPFVMGKADAAFSRSMKIEDTTIGWRFINARMKAMYGVSIQCRRRQRMWRLNSASRGQARMPWPCGANSDGRLHRRAGFFMREIVPVSILQKKGDPKLFGADEHPRPETTIEALAKLKGVVRPVGTVTRRQCLRRE